jgi:hypothetical protein
MIALAFWNIFKNQGACQNIADLLFDLSSNLTISGPDGEVLLGIAEPGEIDDAEIVKRISLVKPGSVWWARWSIGKRFLLIGNIQSSELSSFPEVYGCFPNTLTRSTPARKTLPIWFVHLESPQGARSNVVHGVSEGAGLRHEIVTFENSVPSGDTIAIGDFNMAPYDAGMVAPRALNAVPCRTVAAKTSRTIKGTPYSYFFNPMWELLGSQTASQQPGTFFMTPRDDSTQWYILDQVILRPDVIAHMHGVPKIITRVGVTSLLTKRNGINKKISDHLPIVLSLKI